ncbi:hypothetical protein VTJ04DRAFT_8921 [Mycothermus thermophilus]|uniref:uncharacterized protein n=1 Tax=Humicola insolens TaxID=85995 RepID=UPI0037446E01
MEMEEEQQLSPPLFSRSTPPTVFCAGSVCQLQTARPEIGSSKKSRSSSSQGSKSADADAYRSVRRRTRAAGAQP